MRALLLSGAGLLAVAGAIAGAACFSERGGTTPITGNAECQIPLPVIQAGHVVVAIRDFVFTPDSIAVAPGTTVTWVNCESPPQEPHTTTSDAAVWDSPDLDPGDYFSHTFPSAGAFPYHCEPHPFMTGKVIVQ